jgi:hypothetical protein
MDRFPPLAATDVQAEKRTRFFYLMMARPSQIRIRLDQKLLDPEILPRSWTRMDEPDQKIEERNFASLKRTLPGVRDPEYLGLAQPCFN